MVAFLPVLIRIEPGKTYLDLFVFSLALIKIISKEKKLIPSAHNINMIWQIKSFMYVTYSEFHSAIPTKNSRECRIVVLRKLQSNLYFN